MSKLSVAVKSANRQIGKSRFTNYELRITNLASRIARPASSPLPVLCLAFAILVLMHSFATPVFEAPDEVWHYAYARWLAGGNGLPAMDNDDSGANQEVAQPPLYYGVAALLSAPFPDDDLVDLLWGNPGFGYQSPGTSADNKNMLIHTERERFPWRGAALAIHITRLTSLLFGLLTVVAAWGLGHETFGTRRGALITAALVAFHPQFVFICSVVSNDSAAAALCTVTLWATARILRQGLTPHRALAIGIATGLSTLTKTSAILILPLTGTALLFSASLPKSPSQVPGRRFRVLRKTVLNLGLYALAALLTGGWWYGRNLVLYGDPLGMSSHIGTPWGRPAPVSLLALLPEMPLLLRSFWAAYGWGHVTWGDGVYWILWGASGYFVMRGAYRIVRKWAERKIEKLSVAAKSARQQMTQQASILLFVIVWLLGILAALFQWMRQVQAPHGRLLFPALGAWALLLACGMTQEKTHRNRPKGGIPRFLSARITGGAIRTRFGNRGYIFILFLLAALAPGTRILATFAPPRLISPDNAMRGLSPANLIYAEQGQLLGVSVNTQRAQAGDTFTVKACWQALTPIGEDYTVFIHLIGPENSRVAERHTYPGLGRFPTSLWPVKRAFCDTYRVPIEPWAEGPIRYNLEIGMFSAQSGAQSDTRLEATNNEGNPVEPPIAGTVIVTPKSTTTPQPQRHAEAILGNAVKLYGYDVPGTASPGEAIAVMLYWEALSAPDADFVAFVHLWRPGDSAPLAQHDGPPRNGWYPTSLWQPGEVITDFHTLVIPGDLPAGQYPLWAGLYRREDGTRMVVEGPTGPYAYNLIPLGYITIK